MVGVVVGVRFIGVLWREVVAEMSSLFLLQSACLRSTEVWEIRCVNIWEVWKMNRLCSFLFKRVQSLASMLDPQRRNTVFLAAEVCDCLASNCSAWGIGVCT